MIVEHTFVIPAYKKSIYLKDCIESLINQRIKSKVIITTSTPSSYIEDLAILFNIPYYINNSEIKGIGADWNFALSKVETELVTIAHQDDIYDPNYTSEVLKRKGSLGEEGVLFLFTDYYNLFQGRKKAFTLNLIVKRILLTPFYIKNNHQSKWLKKSIYLFGDPICCPSVTLNLKDTDDFRFSEELKCALDWKAWIDISEKKGVVSFITKRLMYHRIHPESETTNQLLSGVRRKEEKMIFQKMWGKTLGNFWSWLYSLGHKENLV